MFGAKPRTSCPLAPLLPPNNLSPYFDAFLNKAEQHQMLQIVHFNQFERFYLCINYKSDKGMSHNMAGPGPPLVSDDL